MKSVSVSHTSYVVAAQKVPLFAKAKFVCEFFFALLRC